MPIEGNGRWADIKNARKKNGRNAGEALGVRWFLLIAGFLRK
jgi:hypothetical protein